MVREKYRNQGMGSALVAAMLAEARTRGLVHVTLHSGRRAVDFYLRNGFNQPGPVAADRLAARSVNVDAPMG